MKDNHASSGSWEKKLISVVIPGFNEAGNITKLTQRLVSILEPSGYNFELVFINDGSSDNSQDLLESLHELDPRINHIRLSRNFGHQNALKAGLDYASGDCVITMDGDLQHPPELLPTFIKKWEEGYDIVYSRRKDASTSGSKFKRVTSNSFYYLLNTVSEVKLEPGTADFRLIDRKVVEVLMKFQETDPFMRGVIKWVGFSQYPIDYIPDARFSGKSKYSFKKMVKFALQGITSFSIRPLYTAVYIGFSFSGISALYVPYVLYSYFNGHVISGWASLMMTIVFIGGLQLIIMGIIGIYIGKVFLQTKQRPNYIVRSTSLAPSKSQWSY
ncbi:glycosyltransferase family 2 protein [Hufsiella ginkgonis]|uniref:Glycosyltransferase n=1 Tax=Hufsiella ginkgonis TaxID=2695274 RepID=A0A7K1XXD0_9SPHI|nr:glycosyltransferase family 2 protein [Hufsiella ginkgonis]MXV15166.1 glycosyltransferase [Hufsiella ginkgonis]